MVKYLKTLTLIFLFIFCFGISSCGTNTDETSTSGTSQTITIIDLSFLPASVTVAAGDTLFFFNEDSVSHRILTESAEGLFDNTGDMDTGVIPTGQSISVTVPGTLVSGDSILFYDDEFKDTMTTPDGTITIE